jgi:hypothetical protein
VKTVKRYKEQHSLTEVSWKPKCKLTKWAESRNGDGAVVVVSVVIVTITELT